MTQFTFPRISLGLVGATFAILGIAFLVAPNEMAAIVGLETRRLRPLVEIRAMYRGFELGLGIFFLVAAIRTRWIRAALAAQILGLAGLAFGRIVGMALSQPDRLMMAFATIEIAGAALGAAAFRVAKTAHMNSRSDRRKYD